MARRKPGRTLVDVAERLFRRTGIHGVGIDAILAESGCSSRSLYQHFGSKDGLAAAALQQHGTAWLAWLAAETQARAAEPADRLLAIFDALETSFRAPDFYGCLFAKVAGEFPESDHALRRIAADHKRALLAFLKDLAAAAGFAAPARLARELLLLIEGAMATALILREPAAAATARRAAAALIEARRSSASEAANPANPGCIR